MTDSGEEIVDIIITDEDGYYAIGNLEDNWYQIIPEDYDYIFSPNFAYASIFN